MITNKSFEPSNQEEVVNRRYAKYLLWKFPKAPTKNIYGRIQHLNKIMWSGIQAYLKTHSIKDTFRGVFEKI